MFFISVEITERSAISHPDLFGWDPEDHVAGFFERFFAQFQGATSIQIDRRGKYSRLCNCEDPCFVLAFTEPRPFYVVVACETAAFGG